MLLSVISGTKNFLWVIEPFKALAPKNRESHEVTNSLQSLE